MEPLDYCSNFLIGGYNSDGSTRLYSLVEEDELLASIRGRIMKKIALINPPFRGVIHRIKDAYPLGLGYIKAYCESKGVVCDLYDFSCSLLSDQALEEKYCLSDYDVIGVSSYSLFFSDTVVLIAALYPNIRYTHLGFADMGISSYNEEQMASIIRVVRRLKPSIIVLPSENDIHPDHIQTSLLVKKGVEMAASNFCADSYGAPHNCKYILSYRFPGKTSPVADCGTKIYMDVSEVYEEKMKLIKTYKSQIFRTEENSKTEINRGLLSLIESTDRINGSKIGACYAEELCLVKGCLGSENLFKILF